MNGKENIIQRILSDAEAKCNEMIASAEAQSERILRVAEEKSAADARESDARASVQAEDLIRNKLAATRLAARKYKLNVKQRLISECYAEAVKTLVDASDEKRLEFIGKLISRYAESGETVLVCQRDAKLVNQKFLDAFGKNLTVGSRHIAEFGVVLVGEGYEKDLTIEKIVQYSRLETEAKVSAALFGE
mgnify:FL=1